jgi:hypothetical protein
MSSPTHSSAASPTPATYPNDPTRKVTMDLDFHDAVHYTIAECQNWLQKRGVKPLEEGLFADAEWTNMHTNKPWWHGYYKGVRIDQVVLYCFRVTNQSFAHNPYGLGPFNYWLILMAMALYVALNFGAGYMSASEVDRRFIELLKGVCASIPVVWMYMLLLYPALIANVRDQYAAMGHEI